jgi:ABC-2 type transport system ATP-binding protein
MVPEEEAVYKDLTAQSFVELNARLAGVSDWRAAADGALETVALFDERRRRLGGFSKGMRQRAKVAAALVAEPEVLILDEPLNGTDPVQRAHLIRLFVELGRRGRTLIVSSHVLAEVERMAHRVVAMVDGRLAAVGDLTAIRAAMTDKPRLVWVDSDQPRRLGAALLESEGVAGIGIDGTRLEVQTIDHSRLAMELPAIALRIGAGLSRVEPADESLESIFRYLVQGR